MRLLDIYKEGMNKENEKKIKGVKKLQAREGNIFLMLILLLHIHNTCLPERVCVISPAVMKILLWPVEK